ncbi:hypothetical protein SFUMM280S_10780 [Streptomyces fumanus]
MQQPGAVRGAGAGEQPGALAVDLQGAGLVGLGVVDSRVRGAVDHQVGAVPGERGLQGGRFGDVQVGAAGGDHVLAAPGQLRDHVPAEHAARAGDQPPHVGSPVTRRFSGSHQARLSRYQATVSARPVAKSRRGR